MKERCVEVAQLLKALSHPQRLMILNHILYEERTVSELQKLCDISQSQLSQFLNRMKLEGLVKVHRMGRFCYYGIANKKIVQLVETVHHIFCR